MRVVDGIDITVERLEAEVAECRPTAVVDENQRCRGRMAKGRSKLGLGRVRIIHCDWR